MKRLLPELALPRPLIQATVTTRDFMSTRPNSEPGSNDASRDQPLARGAQSGSTGDVPRTHNFNHHNDVLQRDARHKLDA